MQVWQDILNHCYLPATNVFKNYRGRLVFKDHLGMAHCVTQYSNMNF